MIIIGGTGEWGWSSRDEMLGFDQGFSVSAESAFSPAEPANRQMLLRTMPAEFGTPRMARFDRRSGARSVQPVRNMFQIGVVSADPWRRFHRILLERLLARHMDMGQSGMPVATATGCFGFGKIWWPPPPPTNSAPGRHGVCAPRRLGGRAP